MADWKQHARDCEEILGNQWIVIHHWLDEYARIYFPLKVHRVHRHHREGINEIKDKWGEEASKAAMIHILTDEGEILTKKEICKKYNVKE